MRFATPTTAFLFSTSNDHRTDSNRNRPFFYPNDFGLYGHRFDDTEKDRADTATIEAARRRKITRSIRTRHAEQYPSAINAGASFCKPGRGSNPSPSTGI